ncbi:hypothetical protein ACWDE4_38300, partial [Streptomyces hydrogenans]
MDFLPLLPHGQRIILEVDGSQHYTRDRGRTPDTAKYAAVVAADRDLRLSGHEVYRFGHDELRDGTEAKGAALRPLRRGPASAPPSSSPTRTATSPSTACRTWS